MDIEKPRLKGLDCSKYSTFVDTKTISYDKNRLLSILMHFGMTNISKVSSLRIVMMWTNMARRNRIGFRSRPVRFTPPQSASFRTLRSSGPNIDIRHRMNADFIGPVETNRFTGTADGAVSLQYPRRKRWVGCDPGNGNHDPFQRAAGNPSFLSAEVFVY